MKMNTRHCHSYVRDCNWILMWIGNLYLHDVFCANKKYFYDCISCNSLL